jgi:hypothetical protein
VTIRKGEPWGEPVGSDAASPRVVAASDREIALAADRGETTVGVVAGDLCRTLGGRGSLQTIAPIDLGTAVADDVRHTFAAHVVARSPGWRGRFVMVMNAEHLARWDVAPRSHPNDGRLDTLDATLSLSDRWKAWRRIRLGTHLPHPAIIERRVTEASFAFEQPLHIFVDGEHVGTARRLDVACRPDAIHIVF